MISDTTSSPAPARAAHRGWLRQGALMLSLCGLLAGTSCDKNGKLNLLSIEDDKKLGAQTAAQIESDPANYPLLPEAGNEQAYAYLRGIKDKILQSGKITYKDDFLWKVMIVKDDSTLNAFCTPGGYIYVYTGLIKYLDQVDQLAGVMGHEMGHADKRHTSRQITQQQGYNFLIGVLLGNNPGALAGIALQLKDLKYSRNYEMEADEASVNYLAATTYACNGAAGFFEKLNARGSGRSQPVFLSTHPSGESRVADINKTADKIKCSKTPNGEAGYAAFKASL